MASTISFQRSPKQRPAESPRFWITLLAGSLLVNLVAALAFQATLQQLKPLNLAFAPIAVEFVAPAGKQTTSTPASPKPQTTFAPKAAAAPAAQTPPPSQAPLPGTSATSAIAVPPATTVAPPATEPEAEPTDELADDPPKTKRSAPTQPATESSAPETEQRPNPEPTPPANTQASGTAPTPPMPPTTPLETGPVQSGRLLPGVPVVPDPERNQVAEDPIRPTRPQVISQNPVPAKFFATLTIAAVPPTPDPVEAPVLQDEPTKTFLSQASHCTLHPDALHSFGQPVVLQIEINPKGQVVAPVQVRSSSQNDRYDQLAQCVVREWQFKPAMTTQAEQVIPVSGRLTVELAIAHRAG